MVVLIEANAAVVFGVYGASSAAVPGVGNSENPGVLPGVSPVRILDSLGVNPVRNVEGSNGIPCGPDNKLGLRGP